MKHHRLFILGLVFALSACATPTSLPSPSAIPPTATSIPPTAIPSTATALSPAATPLPTTTPIPPTPTIAPPTATVTQILATPTALPKGARGFSVFETEHANVLAQPGVNDYYTTGVGNTFELGYQVVGEDLGYADRRSQLYVYRSEDDLFQDLVATWHYEEWYRTNRVTPRMHRDYIEWVPMQRRDDAAFITHEYNHRIIEQIAGVNSQVTFKWFDEGLADYEGLRALAKRSPVAAGSQRSGMINSVFATFAGGALIGLKDMTTEGQWHEPSGPRRDLFYHEAYVAMDYLISQHGIAQVKSVLSWVGTGLSFADAFQKVYSQTVDEFEREFLAYVAKLRG